MSLAVVLTSTLIAMGPQWALIDLPYPEVSGSETAAPFIEPKMAEAVANYAKGRAGKSLNTKPEIAPLKVGLDSASLRVKIGDRSEIVLLNRVGNEWRVVQSLTEGREY